MTESCGVIWHLLNKDRCPTAIGVNFYPGTGEYTFSIPAFLPVYAVKKTRESAHYIAGPFESVPELLEFYHSEDGNVICEIYRDSNGKIGTRVVGEKQ